MYWHLPDEPFVRERISLGDRHAERLSLWQRFKGLFSGWGDKSRAPTDPSSLRSRAEDLLQRLEDGVAANAAARRAALQGVRADLVALVRDLLESADLSEPLAGLLSLVAGLPALLGAQASDEQVNDHWQGIVTALSDWLAQRRAPETRSAGREEFWK
jgi:hypothetical protein